MKNTIIKRIFSIFLGTTILTTTILAASLPISAVPVYAAQSNKTTISGLCTGAIGNPNPGAGGWSYVYYGKYNNAAMKYRVLDIAATQFGGNTMLLDCDRTIKNMHFDGDSNVWANSEIRTWLNGNDFYGNASVFTAQEKAAIAISTKETPDTSDPNNKDGDGSRYLSYARLSQDADHIDHIFLLDAKEATRSSYGYKNTDSNDNTRKKSTTWWLRSPHSSYANQAGMVHSPGTVRIYEVTNVHGVSPAFNLNLSSVIFSSLIPNKTNEYNLTVKDTNMTIAKTDGSDVTREGNVVTVPYTITGGNPTQVSVLITDDEYSPGTVAKDGNGYAYQKLNVETWGTSGTGTFTLPDAYADRTWGTDYHVYILAEEVKGTYETDYASVPVPITISRVATPTFSPEPKTYTEEQKVTISCETEGATIHYTTDESEPTATSPTYNGSITVSKTTTIKAIAVKDGMPDSEVAEATYTISDSPADEKVNTEGDVSISVSEETLKILNDSLSGELKEKVEKAISEGKEVDFVFQTKDLDEDAEGAKDIEKYDKENGLTLGQLFDITLIVRTSNGEELGRITETSGKITFEVEIPEELREDGRMFYILKFHDNSVSEVGKGKGPKVKAATDEFSTYAIAYKDGGSKDKDDDKDDDHEDHTPPSWVLNPNEKQQLVITFTGTPAGLTAGYQEQGKAAQVLFDTATPAGWKKAFSFNLLNKERRPEMSLKNGTLKLYIPTEYQNAGRQFAIIAMDKNGKTYLLTDTDTDPGTVTVNVSFEGYAMELIYKD